MSASHHRPRIRSRLAAALSAGICLLALARCNTPFIPIPPPSDPRFTPLTVADPVNGTKTVWETRSEASDQQKLATIFIYNLNVGAGVIARAQADGSYVANPIEGKRGDHIQIYYETPAGQPSLVICRPLGEGLVRIGCQ